MKLKKAVVKAFEHFKAHTRNDVKWSSLPNSVEFFLHTIHQWGQCTDYGDTHP